MYDAGTGLPSTARFEPAWHKRAVTAVDGRLPCSVGILHPCGLRWLNAHAGHDVGDEVIRAVAARIALLVEPSSLSYGNSQFHLMSCAPLADLAHRLETLDGPYEVGQRVLELRVVHGLTTLTSASPEDWEGAWREADLALWVAENEYRYSGARTDAEAGWAVRLGAGSR